MRKYTFKINLNFNIHFFSSFPDFLIKDQTLHTVLGVQGFLRVLLPLILTQSTCDYIKIIEIYELCLQYLNESNHTLINASLEVINVILQNANIDLKRIIKNSDSREILMKRKTLKNLIFHLVLTESKMNSRKSSIETIKHSTNNPITTTTPTASPNITTLKVDEKSLNNIVSDVESLKSMDFDAEIDLCDSKLENDEIVDSRTSTLKNQKSTETIGSFINSLLSHPNTDSVSKFFRGKIIDSPVKSIDAADGIIDDNRRSYRSEDDALSLESMNNSFVSMQSLPDQSDSLLLPVKEDEVFDESTIEESLHEATTTTITPTTSNAMPDIKIDSISDENDKSFVHIDVDNRREIYIGNILEQTIIEYTVRLICSKFLLTGERHQLISDTIARVSIKNLSLSIIANCIAIQPQVLFMNLEREPSNTNVDLQNYEFLNEDDVGLIDDSDEISLPIADENLITSQIENLTSAADSLEIKDDHFGESSTQFLDLFSPLSKSVDASPLIKYDASSMFRSEILTTTKLKVNISLNTDITKMLDDIKCEANSKYSESQKIYDVIIFAKHSDPILRSNVQNIIGNFIMEIMKYENLSYDDFLADEKSKIHLNLQRLLSIILDGLFDEVYMVVKQALNALENIFPYIIKSKLVPISSFITSDNQMMPGASNFSSITTTTTNQKYDCTKIQRKITKKFILENLFLVHDNRYWVIQCKYGDVISNLDYNLIRLYVNENCCIKYRTKCLEHLLQLLRDNDVRVRNYITPLVYNFIEKQNYKNSFQNIYSLNKFDDLKILYGYDDGGYKNNIIDGHDYVGGDILAILSGTEQISSNIIIKDFVNRRIFNELPKPLCYINVIPNGGGVVASDGGRNNNQEFNKTLAQVLYVLSNKILEIDDENQQVSCIFCIYYSIWNLLY